MIIPTLIIILLIMLLWCLLFYIRNYAVEAERRRVLDAIYLRTLEDIDNGKDYTEVKDRYAVLHNISYKKMLFEFWKPVNSYFKEIN